MGVRLNEEGASWEYEVEITAGTWSWREMLSCAGCTIVFLNRYTHTKQMMGTARSKKQLCF